MRNNAGTIENNNIHEISNERASKFIHDRETGDQIININDFANIMMFLQYSASLGLHQGI